MSLLLSCQNLSKAFGGRPLFEGISLTFQDDERLGLMGPNGSGKSTLLKILAGVEDADDGDVVLSNGVRLGYLPQVDVFAPGVTVHQVLVDAQDSHLESFTRESEARIMASKLDFTDTAQTVSTLSGGWRKRLAIGRALIQKPDLLLMDEPTNHLDLEGILWLEAYLKSARLAFVVITHDRYFLENVTKRVVEFDKKYPQGFFSVPGNYTEFLTRREEYFAGQMAYQESLGNKVRREIDWLQRGPKARTTKAKARIDEAGRMIGELSEIRGRTSANATAQIDFTGTQRRTKELVIAEKISKGHGGRQLIKDLSITLSPGVRLGLLGLNGSGKTTLLRMISGQDKPDTGTVRQATDLRMVLFDQNRHELDKKSTLRNALAPAGGEAVVYRGQSVHIASWAKRFLFRVDQLDRLVGTLSGGEQARVLIARLMLEPADVLLLDEPTNDLDIPTLELLEESLIEFPGSIVLVTHDRYMLDRISTLLLGLDGQGGAIFYADYSQWQAGQVELAVPKEKGPEKKSTGNKGKKLTFNEQREWDAMEETILQAENVLADWQKQLEDPANMSNPSTLQKCAVGIDEAQSKIDSLYARWAELGERTAK